MIRFIDRLAEEKVLSKSEFTALLDGHKKYSEYLFSISRKTAQDHFSNKIYIRGLIEFSNICKNNCYYCGIRSSNKNISRYRLSKEDIWECCREGYSSGVRTFVLQGGEDPYFSDEILISVISKIRQKYPDCAITLSLGERGNESYRKLFKAGANRYLLRHETADPLHYSRLHPSAMSAEDRVRCLKDLKRIGFQIGTGFMVGSPYQTNENIADDLLFIRELEPQMVGIGPFLPHHDTPMGKYPAGSLEKTLFLIGILRLMLPDALIPSTTALASLDPTGRERGILAGANVIMPNISPFSVREKYSLYDNKIRTGAETAEGISLLKAQMNNIGYEIVIDRGDWKG